MTTISLPPLAARAVAALPARIERLRPLARRLALDGVLDDPRWLGPIAIAAYALAVTWAWEFPNSQGIPFPPLWIGATGALLYGWWLRRGTVEPYTAAAIVAVTAMVMTDVTLFSSQWMRDLKLYLKAGDLWLAGVPVYLRVPLTVAPIDLSNYPFLYPPMTLPLFAAVAQLPFPIAAGLWVAGSVAAVLAGLRLVGLDLRWSLLFLAWPPIAQGLQVGNVATPLFLLFAAAPLRPVGLAFPPIFKVYSGLAALWLLRREHWRSLALGVVAVGALALATLAITGPTLWMEWLTGLQAYQVSQQLLPNNLYGFGLARYLPWPLFAAIAAGVAVLALRARERRDQLARLGVATVVASPSLFSHGFTVALPAMLALDTGWFWLAFGITACSPGLTWFVAVALVAASWFVPRLRKPGRPDEWHPLGAAPGPWPDEAIGATGTAGGSGRDRTAAAAAEAPR